MAFGAQVDHILKSYVLKSFTIGFGILYIVIVIWLLHSHVTSAYTKAKRARSAGHEGLAVQLFTEAVKRDAKGISFRALLALMEADDLLALEALIGLIDLPDLRSIVGRQRELMSNVIRKRSAGTTADKLPLSPYAPQDVRAEEKRQWQAWLTKAKDKYDWVKGRFVPRAGGKLPHPKPASGE